MAEVLKIPGVYWEEEENGDYLVRTTVVPHPLLHRWLLNTKGLTLDKPRSEDLTLFLFAR